MLGAGYSWWVARWFWKWGRFMTLGRGDLEEMTWKLSN